MSEMQIPKISSLILIIFFLAQCKQAEKDNAFKSIKNYFDSREWDFPITILDTTLSIKNYPDTLSISNVSEEYSDLKIIIGYYSNSKYIKRLLERVTVDTSSPENNGYIISKPTIIIDTSVYGSAKNPKVYLGFNVSRYKINSDSLSNGIPCENCLMEEKNKILRYPYGIYFELSEKRDSLIFSKWD